MKLEGGCHCGAVRFTCQTGEPPLSALRCNCSVCSMTGFIHLIVPHADFTLRKGEQDLTSYRFGSGTANHLFCRHCGVKSFYQPRSHPEAWSVNSNCLDDPPALDISDFDGRNWEQAKQALDEGEGAG